MPSLIRAVAECEGKFEFLNIRYSEEYAKRVQIDGRLRSGEYVNASSQAADGLVGNLRVAMARLAEKVEPNA